MARKVFTVLNTFVPKNGLEDWPYARRVSVLKTLFVFLVFVISHPTQVRDGWTEQHSFQFVPRLEDNNYEVDQPSRKKRERGGWSP